MLSNLKRAFLKRKLVKETTWSFLAKGTTFVLYFALNILLARKLGPEKLGVWSLFYSVFTIYVTVTALGLNSSIRTFVARYRNDDSSLKSVLKSSTKLKFVVSSIATLLFIFIRNPLASNLNNPQLRIIILYGVPFVFFYNWVNFFKEVFAGLHRIKFDFIVNLFEHSANLVFSLIFLSISVSVVSVVNAFSLSSIIVTIIGFLFLYFVFYKNLNFDKNKSENFRKKILEYSFPFIIIKIAAMIFTQADTIMLGMLSTEEQIGIFSVANNFGSKLSHISLAIAMGTMPIFAKKDANLKKLKKTFNKLIKINSYIFIPLGLVLLIFSQDLMSLFFGQNYSQSSLVLQLILPSAILSSYMIFFVSFLNYRGLAQKRAIYLSFAAVANIILNYVFIPQMGAPGAALSTSIAYIPYAILNWMAVQREFKRHIDSI